MNDALLISWPIWLIVTAVVSFLMSRRIVKHWTMTQRREQILLEFYVQMGDHFTDGLKGNGVLSVQDAVEIFSVCSVKMADECFNQEKALASRWARLWPRVPEIGEEWPNFEPAPFDMLDDIDER